MIDQQKLHYFPTTAISDGQNGRGYIAGNIQAIEYHHTLVGRAITVSLPVGENAAVLDAIKACQKGDVLVVDAKGDMNRAVAGDFVISLMQKLGVAGLIVDGVIRDIESVKALDFPVFCKGTTAVAGVKNGGGLVNIPISIGQTVVTPGDFIFADADGVVVVPQEDIFEVVERTKAKLESDAKRESDVLSSIGAARAYLEKMTSE